MLTEAERKFIENPSSHSPHYVRVMRWRLNKKLRQLCVEYALLKTHIDLIIKKNDELNLDIEVLECIEDLVITLKKTVISETKKSDSEMSILDMNKMA